MVLSDFFLLLRTITLKLQQFIVDGLARVFFRKGVDLSKSPEVILNILISFLDTLFSFFLLFFRAQLIFLAGHHPHISALFSELDSTFLELFGQTHEY